MALLCKHRPGIAGLAAGRNRARPSVAKLGLGFSSSKFIKHAISAHRSLWGLQTRRITIKPCAAQPSAAQGTIVRTPGSTAEIRWGSYLSKSPSLPDAVNEAVDRILESIGRDSQPELALVFVSSVYGPDFESVVPMLRERLPSLKSVFGCSVSGAPCMG